MCRFVIHKPLGKCGFAFGDQNALPSVCGMAVNRHPRNQVSWQNSPKPKVMGHTMNGAMVEAELLAHLLDLLNDEAVKVVVPHRMAANDEDDEP